MTRPQASAGRVDPGAGQAAYGTPAQCAAAVRAQLDLGVTEVIMHGATPDELAPVAFAFRVAPTRSRLR